MSTDSSASFPKVFHEELGLVLERRKSRNANGTAPSPQPQPRANGDHHPATEDALYERALGEDLCGLAISGGGIRSATFGLGVIQAFAVANFLPKFDYISTVSGGGYIGAWLATWISRAGWQDVLEQLQPVQFSGGGQAFEPDAPPIRHLRRYSNYLAPRIGLLSLDSWVLISIYLRNLLLNQLVLLLLLVSVFLACRTGVEVFTIAHTSPSSASEILSFTRLALVGFFVCLIVFAIDSRLHFMALASVIMMAAVAVLGSLVIAANHPLNAASGPGMHSFLAFVEKCQLIALLAASHGVIGLAIVLGREFSRSARTLRDAAQGNAGQRATSGEPSLWAVVSGALANWPEWLADAFLAVIFGVMAGLLGAACTYGTAWLLIGLAPAVAPTIVLGPPLLIGAFVLANYLHVGLLGRILPRYNRERWSSLNARCHAVQVVWLALFGIVVYGPWLIDWIASTSGSWKTLLTTVLGGSWVGTTLVGLVAGGAPKSQRQKSLGQVFARAAPYVFVVGALILVSFGASRLLRVGYDTLKDCTGIIDPKTDTLSYLQNLDKRTCPVVVTIPWYGQRPLGPLTSLLTSAAISFVLARFLSGRVGVNAFSLHDLYALRLIRCYLGASREGRHPNPLTNLDARDDEHLSDLVDRNCIARCGPYPILNGTLNRKVASTQGTPEQRVAEALSFQDRQGESFIFSPLYCGSIATGYCRSNDFAENIKIGTAMAVSGAAVSPHQGRFSTPALSALLTAFNVRLGAWFGNPAKSRYRNVRNPPSATLTYFWNELTGVATADRDYVYVSDGGHFENMGVYELIRRRCRFIVAVDSWADPQLSRENLGRLVRQVRVDFGINIEIDIDETKIADSGFCNAHFSLGRIHYGDIHPSGNGADRPALNDPNFHYEANEGILVYLKVGLTGDEPNDLLNYRSEQPLFPHHPITDQFFDEAQFESYRELGFHTVKRLLEGRPVTPGAAPQTCKSLVLGPEIAQKVSHQTNRAVFTELYNRWMSLPPNRRTGLYAQFNQEYSRLMNELRSAPALRRLASELYDPPPQGQPAPAAVDDPAVTPQERTIAERLMVLEMMTLLGSVWFELSLDKFHRHPINSGWIRVFRRWMASPIVKSHWQVIEDEFSVPFRNFLKEIQ